MKTVLYLGTDPSQFESYGHAREHLIHYPVIKIVPRSVEHLEVRRAFDDLPAFTHILFTSKNAVHVFCSHLQSLQVPLDTIRPKTLVAIGAVTAAHLAKQDLPPQHTAQQETQEGVIALLKRLDLDDAYLFLPRSSLSRPVLVNYLNERKIRYQACDLYDTQTRCTEPKPDLATVDKIVFTSPSTVKAFLEIFGPLPQGKQMLAVGPVTEQALLEAQSSR